MRLGTTIVCPKSGRRGTFLAKTATGGLVCQDKAGRFIVDLAGTGRGPKPGKRKPKFWAATPGGDMNPELVELAGRVKASREERSRA